MTTSPKGSAELFNISSKDIGFRVKEGGVLEAVNPEANAAFSKFMMSESEKAERREADKLQSVKAATPTP